MKKTLALFFALIMLTCALTACQPAAPQPAAAPTAEAAANPEAAPAEKAETKDFDFSKVKIGAISYNSNQTGTLLLSGIAAACDEVGAEMLAGFHKFDVSIEMELYQNYRAMQVDGICASLANDNSSLQAAKEAYKDGIVIATVNSAVVVDEAIAEFYTDPYEIGKMCAEIAAEKVNRDLGGNCVCAILALSPGSVGSNLRCQGFMETMAKLCEGEFKLITTQYGSGIEVNMQIASDLINANPDINMLFGVTEGHTVGLVQAIKNTGKADQVFGVGVDITDQTCQLLRESGNVLLGLVGQDMYAMGYNSGKELLACIAGNPPKPELLGVLTPVDTVVLTADHPEEIDAYLATIAEQYNDKLL